MSRFAAVRRVLRDAFFLSIIVFLLGCILLLWSRLEAATKPPAELWSEILRDFGIVLCSIGIISILYEMLIRRQLISDYNGMLRDMLDPDARKLGVSAMFANRDEKSHRGRSIEEVLRGTRKEIVCVGLGFYQFLPEKRDLLLAKLRENCRFRFLIFDAASAHATALDASLGRGNQSLVSFLQAQQKYFVDFLDALTKDGVSADRFQVRLYDVIPTFGALHIDPSQPDGRLIVELFGHGVEGTVCPGLELVARNSPWFAFYNRQIEELWQNGRPLTSTLRVAASA